MIQSLIDSILKAVVRTHHADSDVPVEVLLVLIEIEDAHRLVRMRQIEIGGSRRGDRGRINLMIGECVEAVDLEAEGRCRHMPLADYHGSDGSDLDPDLGVLVETSERCELACAGHREHYTRA